MSYVELSDDILECQPLKSLKSVLEWVPPVDSWAKLVIKKSERTSFCHRNSNRGSELSDEKLPRCSVPKTLVCHDMKGGYLEDRFVYGSNKHDEYRFMHWSCVDVFVYFSHNFITIPPLAWINSGHRHGVSVLGTLITEWKDGQKIWDEVLEDPSKTLLLCEKLCEIATYYGFDGFLINVENEIKSNHIYALVDFVKILKSIMASSNPDSLIYWYDSVIYPSGKISYQNKLNVYNIEFFDVCDGIFLNYSWKKEDLVQSATNGGERRRDVFVGVDIFGRNFFGGGGFNTRLALEMINLHDLSIALFAPGWVHETLPEDINFLDRDYLFWSSIRPLLYCKGPAGLPFKTSFCQGYGIKRFQRGIAVSDYSWYDLSKQEYQMTDIVGSLEKSPCISHYNENAFNGGSCLLIKQCTRTNEHKKMVHRLFVTEFKILYESVIKITVITSQIGLISRSNFILVLSLENGDGTLQNKTLCTKEEMEDSTEISDFVLPKSTTYIHENRISVWEEWNFELKLVNTTIVAIGCALGKNENSSVLLGHISIEAEE